jgi:large conductance mechanosensitive channel
LSILKEFREFAVKGNVVDMAVGVIVGGAFGKIITSLVNDIVMPPIGLAVGGVNFSALQIPLKDAVGTAPAVALKYGAFLQTIFDFLIVASAIFLAVRFINRLKREEKAAPAAPAAPPETTKEEVLLGEIRDALRDLAKSGAPRG